jgi:hypothetical protein
MEQGVEMVQQAVKSKGNGRWEGKSEKWWDSTSTVAPSFMWAACDNVMICFPRKMSFCFNHPHDLDVRLRSQKV